MKKLYRSNIDSIVGGVCGGLADYIGLDSSLVRILFITSFIFWGAGILPYIILWLVVPSR